MRRNSSEVLARWDLVLAWVLVLDLEWDRVLVPAWRLDPALWMPRR